MAGAVGGSCTFYRQVVVLTVSGPKKVFEMSSIACLQDIEDLAMKVLPRNALDYYRSGADQMQTLKENKSAFQK